MKKLEKMATVFVVLFIGSMLQMPGTIQAKSNYPEQHVKYIRHLALSETSAKDPARERLVAMFRAGNIVGNITKPAIVPVTSYVLEPNVVVVSVRCVKPTSGSDEDQLYLSVTNDKGERTKKSRIHIMKAGDVWNPRFGVRIFKSGKLSLLESDSFSADDLIGSFQYLHTGRAGQYIELMKGDGGEYEVTLEVKPFSSPTAKERDEMDEISRQYEAEQQQQMANRERQLVECINKYSAKNPGTDVTKSWCKDLYFAVTRDRKSQQN